MEHYGQIGGLNLICIEPAQPFDQCEKMPYINLIYPIYNQKTTKKEIMIKKLSLPMIAALLAALQPIHMTAAHHNSGYISSWNTNINTALYNSGSISGYNVDIIGHTQNYKNGKISARSSLRINDFKISIDKSKNKNASIVTKYPNGYKNIFSKNQKINTKNEYKI